MTPRRILPASLLAPLLVVALSVAPPAIAATDGTGDAAPPAATAPTAPGLPFQMPAGAEERARSDSAYGSLRLPSGAWDGTAVPAVEPEGAVTQIAWQIRDTADGTLTLLEPLRQQIEAAGFRPVFTCETDGCGGFDFRYASPVLAEPGMHIDLGDFRYLLARRDAPEGASWLAFWVSRSPNHGFVQASLVLPADAPEPQVLPPDTAPAPGSGPASPAADSVAPSPQAPGAPGDAGAIAQAFTTHGSLVLADLDFGSGSTDLADEPFASLDALAAYLKADPARKVTLVGHTDTSGSAEANRTVSAQRAQSVQRRLVDRLGVPAAQVSAEGVGYLSPLTTNLTEEGRAKNRRVEVVLTSTQ